MSAFGGKADIASADSVAVDSVCRPLTGLQPL
jgi:hypothetical protein